MLIKAAQRGYFPFFFLEGREKEGSGGGEWVRCKRGGRRGEGRGLRKGEIGERVKGLGEARGKRREGRRLEDRRGRRDKGEGVVEVRGRRVKERWYKV